ncbi:MAG: GNAT family N-acetyltransferase [Micromonosporaceae bacterium]
MDAPSVTLRPVTEEDLPLLERFCVEPDLMGLDWQGYRDRGGIRRRFEKDGFLGEDDGRFMVAADGHAAGFVAWRDVDYYGRRHFCWNIGITLLPEWRGRGVGSSAQRQLADYLFQFTPVARIEAGALPQNIAEQRALERAGFTREGTLRCIGFAHGAWCDIVIYSRVRTDSLSARLP